MRFHMKSMQHETDTENAIRLSASFTRITKNVHSKTFKQSLKKHQLLTGVMEQEGTDVVSCWTTTFHFVFFNMSLQTANKKKKKLTIHQRSRNELFKTLKSTSFGGTSELQMPF